MSEALPMRAPLGDHDPSERLSPDDLATLRERQHLEAALLAQAQATAASGRTEPGVCTNCGAVCHPRAVYCDADCRADHEVRVKALARSGRRV